MKTKAIIIITIHHFHIGTGISGNPSHQSSTIQYSPDSSLISAMQPKPAFLSFSLYLAQKQNRKLHSPGYHSANLRSYFPDQEITQTIFLQSPLAHFYSHTLTCQPCLPKQQKHPLNHIKFTVLIFLCDFSTIILLSLFFQ